MQPFNSATSNNDPPKFQSNQSEQQIVGGKQSNSGSNARRGRNSLSKFNSQKSPNNTAMDLDSNNNSFASNRHQETTGILKNDLDSNSGDKSSSVAAANLAQTAQIEMQYESIRKMIENAINSGKLLTPLDQIRIIEASSKIHWQLARLKSRKSPLIASSVNNDRNHDGSHSEVLGRLKRALGSVISRDIPGNRDKRFVKSYLMDNFITDGTDIKPAFSLHLYPRHFKVSNCNESLSYDGPMRCLVEAVFEQRLIPEILDLLDLSPHCQFYDGCLLVEVRDYRFAVRAGCELNENKHLVCLRPCAQTLFTDLVNLQASNPAISDEALLDIESHIYRSTETAVCLSPSIEVGRIASIIHYNNRKLDCSRRFKRMRLLDRHKEARIQQTNEDDYYLTLCPRMIASNSAVMDADFKRISFVEEWRRQKTIQDGVPISTDRVKFQPPREYRSDFTTIVRVLKFSKKHSTRNDDTQFTTLIISLLADGTYEAVLRWGMQPDTAIGGQTLRTNLENQAIMEIYCRNFTSIYTQCELNTLISDSRLSSEQLAHLEQHLSQLRHAMAKSVIMMSHVAHGGAIAASPKTHSPTNSQSPTAEHAVKGGKVKRGGAKTKPQNNRANASSSSANPPSQQYPIMADGGEHVASAVSSTTLSTARPHSPQDPPVSSAGAVANHSHPLNQSSISTLMPTASLNMAATNNNLAMNSATAVPPQQQQQSINLASLANNPQFLHNLLRLPFDKVPQEYKQLYIQIRHKLATRSQQQRMQMLQQSQQQQQQQQQQVNQLFNQRIIQQQQQQQPQHITMAQLQLMATKNPALMSSFQTNPAQTLQQINLMLSQQQQQQQQPSAGSINPMSLMSPPPPPPPAQ